MARIFPEYEDQWTDLYDNIENTENKNEFVLMELLKLKILENKENNIEEKLKNFITKIQENYKDNYYHNYLHALHVFKSAIELWNNLSDRVCFDFNPIHHAALLIAAFVHDVGHPGGFNSLLIGKNNELANAYNDQSILENSSLTFTFDLLKNDENNFLVNLSSKEVNKFREILIALVLGTDINDDIRNSYLESIVSKYNTLYGMMDTEKEDGRIVSMVHILRCADVSASMQSNKNSWIWAERFYSECYVIFKGPPGSVTDTYSNQIIHIKNNSLKLVQQIIKLKILNVQFEEIIMKNITKNLGLWKEHAPENIRKWIEKLSK